jgi:glycerol-3-phosphate dehydrogenase
MSKSHAATMPSATADPPAEPTTSAEWRDFTANLGRQREDAEGRLADLLVQRNALALKLRLGSKPARQKADAIDVQVDRLRVEIAEMAAAVAGAEEEVRHAVKFEAAKAEIDKAAQVHLLLNERVAAAKVFDEALDILVNATGNWVRTSRALGSLSPRAPAEYLARVGPYELILRAFFALSAQGGVAGFDRPTGSFARTMRDMVDHIDAPSKAWAEGLVPIAGIQVPADATRAANPEEAA